MAGLKRGAMRKIATLTMAGLLMAAVGAWGQKPPLLAEKEVAAIAGEISGAMAKRNLERIAGISCSGGAGGGEVERVRVERCGDFAVSGGWGSDVWDSEVKASMGCERGGAASPPV